MDSVEPMLRRVGFTNIEINQKQESKEFIKSWMPGTGCEDYVVSAAITAKKPVTPTPEPIVIASAPCNKGQRLWKLFIPLAMAVMVTADLVKKPPTHVPSAIAAIGAAWYLMDTFQNQKIEPPKKEVPKKKKGK